MFPQNEIPIVAVRDFEKNGGFNEKIHGFTQSWRDNVTSYWGVGTLIVMVKSKIEQHFNIRR